MAFATGPFQAPDEDNHFMRAFQLSQGNLFPTLVSYGNGTRDAGGVLPVCLRGTSETFMRMKFLPSEKVNGKDWLQTVRRPFARRPEGFTGFQNTAIYPPISYLPQIVGIWLTRPLGVSPLVMMYMGRVLNLLCWAALVFLAVRVMPVQKWVTVLVGLMPMSVFLAASLSSDPLTNGMSILFVAMVARAFLGSQDMLTVRQKIGMALLAAGIALSKIVYSPLIALLLLIPAERLGGWKRKIVFCLTVIGCSAAVGVGWAYSTRGFIVTREWTNPAGQVSFILHSPLIYLQIVLHTLGVFYGQYCVGLVGLLGWADTILPAWIYWSYPAITLLVAAFSGENGIILGMSRRGMLLALCLLSVLLVETTIFITWTKPGQPMVFGVQGRYFIPVLVPLLLVLYNRWGKVPPKWYGRVLSAYCACVLMSTCLVIAQRYYR
jgi:uncharacterized membrane protein